MKNFSLKICSIKINAVPLHPLNKPWSLRLSVRTRDFHSLKSSSILLGTTNIIHKNKAANLKSSLALHINSLG